MEWREGCIRMTARQSWPPNRRPRYDTHDHPNRRSRYGRWTATRTPPAAARSETPRRWVGDVGKRRRRADGTVSMTRPSPNERPRVAVSLSLPRHCRKRASAELHASRLCGPLAPRTSRRRRPSCASCARYSTRRRRPRPATARTAPAAAAHARVTPLPRPIRSEASA